MRGSTSQEPCFLCGSVAERTKIPWEQGSIYRCSNGTCGDYFLSDMARTEIERGSIDHRPLSDEACRARAIGQYLCLRLDSASGTIKPQISPRCWAKTMPNTDRANTVTEVKNELFIETIKGLFLMNGGGAIALATWLQAVWEKDWATPMLSWQLWGMAVFGAGVFLAGLGYLLRFLAFFHPKTNDPPKNPLWWGHVVASTVSVISFALAVGLVVIGGFAALECRASVTSMLQPTSASCAHLVGTSHHTNR